jgi:ribosomal protein S18 acetylase RimI-like enzyme
MITIREYNEADKEQIWEIIKPIIRKGDTYIFAPDSSREKMLDYWCGADKKTYVAVSDQKILGTFFIKENQPDLGSHICNAGYMVASDARGKGIGRRMAEFSLDEAKRSGFSAMQFNFVVKSNKKAIELWHKLGFEIIGEIPDAYNHLEKGLVNAYVMYRKL